MVGITMMSIFLWSILSKEMLLIVFMTLMFMCMFKLSVMGFNSFEMFGTFYMDFLSLSMVVLSLYICMMSLFSSKFILRVKFFSGLILILFVSLVLAFSVSSAFLFFFFFEVVLVPLLIIIMGWGYQPERFQACTYMFIYTVFGSLFFLFGVSFMFIEGLSNKMVSINSFVFKNSSSFWWLFILGFMIKLPVYPFHLWLPKAHVEAPVAGSMILAGIVLKLGGYGIVRIMSFLSSMNLSNLLIFVLSFSVLGGSYASMVCCRQVDLKCLVAYSSVGHMSLVLMGFLSNSYVGFMGALAVMIGHGFCSSGLFSLVNIFYNNSLSRSVLMNKGFLIKSPVVAIFSFLLCIGNMAAPPSLNLFGEVLLFISIFWVSFFLLFFFMFMSFLSAVYSLYLYTCTCHGKVSDFLCGSSVISYLDVFVLSMHFLPLNLLLFFMV
nr:NADH dehydrogenase subunit 4 [Vignadula atrata]